MFQCGFPLSLKLWFFFSFIVVVGLEEEHEPLLDMVSQMAVFIIALHSLFLRSWDSIWQHWPINMFYWKEYNM